MHLEMRRPLVVHRENVVYLLTSSTRILEREECLSFLGQ
jgi:hypothetical protein